MDNRLVRFTKNMMVVMYYIGIVIIAGIPFIFYWVGSYTKSFRDYYLLQCLLYMASGVMCLMIVYELRKMFITILDEDPFVEKNAESLKRMGKCSFVISFLSLVRIPLSPTPATVVILIVFAIAGLFSIVLCQVFEKAIQYKLENDLTI